MINQSLWPRLEPVSGVYLCTPGPVSGPPYAAGYGLSLEPDGWSPTGLWWGRQHAGFLSLRFYSIFYELLGSFEWNETVDITFSFGCSLSCISMTTEKHLYKFITDVHRFNVKPSYVAISIGYEMTDSYVFLQTHGSGCCASVTCAGWGIRLLHHWQKNWCSGPACFPCWCPVPVPRLPSSPVPSSLEWVCPLKISCLACLPFKN